MRARTTGGSVAAPADTANYLNTSNADYTAGSDVTWADSGADANVISAVIGINATAANKPSNLFGVKFFDTGATVADTPSLQIRWERVTSPETNQTQWPVTVVGFIVVPASTTPDFTVHKAFWIACKYAFTSNANTNGHSVRGDDQTFSWQTVQMDTSAPTNYQCNQMLTLVSRQRMSAADGTAGSIGVGYWLGTTNYPGSGGGGTNLYTTTKTGFVTLTATDKIYAFVGAGAYSGGSGTRTVTGRVRTYVEK
tara:strand:- start:669 stop:1427 length:759 start_codon:yes stop_codon:yes gene_type:complete